MPRLPATLFTTVLLLSSCKGGEQRKENCPPDPTARKTVIVPKFFTSRTIMELQLRLVRSIKIKAWKDLNTWILGGLIKESCPSKALNYDWEACLKGVDTQNLELRKKRLSPCPSPKKAPFASSKCPVTAYCGSITLTLENDKGQRREVTFTDLAKVAEKWWALGPISCKNVQ